MAELLLRVEFSRRGRRRAHLRVQAEGGRRRLLPRRRQGPAARHPDRRIEVWSRRRALPGRLDYRVGLQEQGTDLEARLTGCGREPDAGRGAHAHRRELRHAFRDRSVDAPAARRHAHPSKGAVRAGPARRREIAPRRRQGSGEPAGAHSWCLGRRAAGANGQGWSAACGAPGALPYRCRRRDPRAGGEDDWRPAIRAGGREARSAARRLRAARAVLRGRGARPDRLQAGDGARSSRCSPPTTTRTSTCVTPAAWRCRESATPPRLARSRRIPRAAFASPPSSRSAACAVRRSVDSSPTPTTRSCSRPRAPSTTTVGSTGRCPRWRACSTRSVSRPSRFFAAPSARTSKSARARRSRGSRRLPPTRRGRRECGSRRLPPSASGRIRRRWIASTGSIWARRSRGTRSSRPPRPPFFA